MRIEGTDGGGGGAWEVTAMPHLSHPDGVGVCLEQRKIQREKTTQLAVKRRTTEPSKERSLCRDGSEGGV